MGGNVADEATRQDLSTRIDAAAKLSSDGNGTLEQVDAASRTLDDAVNA
ncbi:hypothetical protein [Bifidobacterium bohemicum]|uniref:Uncharacterized protein n=1 Tax=Bifidobacterium bohemicum DSM 22767 TaxID=1437606 RepID=A0A086ZE03_9BIFI|nr:hypothetical protein [Bifidobacterium bohemicum]KFI44753.1 hypothetical protein BBOH_1479 [Bifidobacterium bohemicum DSM 22767]